MPEPEVRDGPGLHHWRIHRGIHSAGSVAAGLYEAIKVVSFAFPFKAALQALDAAVNSASPGIGTSVLHLAALAAAFGVLARVGLRGVD